MSIALDADFATAPRLHQLREFELHAEDTSRAILWQMRTGKSKLLVDTACHLYKQNKIDAVLVFAPNGVHTNWIDRELVKHSWPSVSYVSFAWSTARSGTEEAEAEFKSALKVKDALPWFTFASATMTRDDVRKLVKRIVRNKGRILGVFDESQDYRAPGSKRSAMARATSDKCLYRRILTGTVVDNNPLHAWSQFRLLGAPSLGHSTFSDFKEAHAVYITKKTRAGRSYSVLESFRDLEGIRDEMALLSSVVLRTDCEDLPDLERDQERVAPTQHQIDVYSQLLNSFMIELESGVELSVGEQTNRIVKLQQVLSGYLVDEFGDLTELTERGRDPRTLATVRRVLGSPGRSVIWCQFRHDLDVVAEALRAEGREVLEYHGRTSEKDKAKARWLMAADCPDLDDPDYGPDLVGQAQSGGSGLDFSAASQVIWHSHTFDMIVRGQADERATAMGGSNVALVDVLVGQGLTDDYIMESQARKMSIAEQVGKTGLKRALENMKLQ